MHGARNLTEIRAKIRRLELKLEAAVEEAQRNGLFRALAIALAAACLAEEEMRFERGGGDPSEDARCWRLRADEYLALSEVISEDPTSLSYQSLSDGYRRLADRAAARVARSAADPSGAGTRLAAAVGARAGAEQPPSSPSATSRR